MRKEFKKIICGISTLAMCLSIAPITASAATTYYRGDVTGNGVVDSRDVTAFNQYLHGSAGAGGAASERLDLNRDYVIDSNDLAMLKQIIIKTIPVIPVSSVNTQMTTAQYEKSYQKHNAQTGVQIGDAYTLAPVSELSETATRSIIGDDNRVIDYSKSGIVKINYTRNGENRVATGFIVDNHTILTAAHCFYKDGYFATNLTYTLYEANDQKNKIEIGTYNAVNYHLPSEYMVGERLVQNDYALITVSENLSSYRCFDLGVCRDGFKDLNTDIWVNGYSGEIALIGQMVTGKGNIAANGNGETIMPEYIHYSVDTVGGTSGGPIYIKNPNNTMTVIGVNTWNSNPNYGKRIDTNVLHFIYNNPNL